MAEEWKEQEATRLKKVNAQASEDNGRSAPVEQAKADDDDWTLDSAVVLQAEDPESRVTDWVEQEPTRLERVYPFWRPKPERPGGNGEALEQLRALVEQQGERLTVVEQAIPGLGTNVITFNTRWGHIVFSAADLLNVDGATRTWVTNELNSLPSLGNVIDGGIY